MKFHRGDIVFIQPQDELDPIATKMQGQRVTVTRRHPAQNLHVYVETAPGVPEIVFREQDLSFISLSAGAPSLVHPLTSSINPATKEPTLRQEARPDRHGRDFSGGRE